MMHPAERIKTHPNTKIITFLKLGSPSAASHKDHKVGHSKSKIPIGLSRRNNRIHGFAERDITIAYFSISKINAGKNISETKRERLP